MKENHKNPGYSKIPFQETQEDLDRKKEIINSIVASFAANNASDIKNTLSLTPNIMTNVSDAVFHNPLHQEVHGHLSNNVNKITLDQLRNKATYTKINICVDGREDGEGIASFGGFAGTLGATLPALKELFAETGVSSEDIYTLIRHYLGNEKFYTHCDDHTQHDTHGASCSDCQTIGCGAIKFMLKPENSDAYGFSDADRAFMWNLIDTNGSIKVLQWDHLEKWIISIENTVRTDKDTAEEYINYTTGNTHKDSGDQYFIHHVTWRNLIIGFLAKDIAKDMIATFDNALLHTMTAKTHTLVEDKELEKTLALLLKEKIMMRSDKHAGNTLGLLAPAKKLVDEKKIIVVKKVSHNNNHMIAQ
jgi:hypothetical protein